MTINNHPYPGTLIKTVLYPDSQRLCLIPHFVNIRDGHVFEVVRVLDDIRTPNPRAIAVQLHDASTLRTTLFPRVSLNDSLGRRLETLRGLPPFFPFLRAAKAFAGVLIRPR